MNASSWAKHQKTWRRMFAPVAKALVEDAQIKMGDTVLDVATGAGDPALVIAQMFGVETRVVGVDSELEMASIGKRTADEGTVSTAHFVNASAKHLPFSSNAFDALVCRLGVMYFESPVDCLREMLRVVKPHGMLALAVWSHEQNNPFHYVPWDIVTQHLREAGYPEDQRPRQAYRFATPDRLRQVLHEAGAATACERILQFKMQADVSPENFWEMRLELSPDLNSEFDSLSRFSAERAAVAKRQVLEALQPYWTKEGMKLPGEVLIVRGMKQ